MPVEERWAYGHFWFIPLTTVKGSHHFAAVCPCGQATLVMPPANNKPLPWMYRHGRWAVLAAIPIVLVVVMTLLGDSDRGRYAAAAPAQSEEDLAAEHREAVAYANALVKRANDKVAACENEREAALAKAFPKPLEKTKAMVDRAKLEALEKQLEAAAYCFVLVQNTLLPKPQGSLESESTTMIRLSAKDVEEDLAEWKTPPGWHTQTRDCDSKKCRATVAWYTRTGEPVAIVHIEEKHERGYPLQNETLYALAKRKALESRVQARR